MSAPPREARSYVWRVAFAIFKVRDRLCADERVFQGRALWGWREQHVVVFGDYDIMSVLGKVRCGAHCLQSHDVRFSRVAAGGKTDDTSRTGRTESRVLWKSAMLTFVVPESGSAAAALRAIVNAGSKINDAC